MYLQIFTQRLYFKATTASLSKNNKEKSKKKSQALVRCQKQRTNQAWSKRSYLCLLLLTANKTLTLFNQVLALFAVSNSEQTLGLFEPYSFVRCQPVTKYEHFKPQVWEKTTYLGKQFQNFTIIQIFYISLLICFEFSCLE